ncbi:hypothetical protein [Halosimplex sp. J119]
MVKRYDRRKFTKGAVGIGVASTGIPQLLSESAVAASDSPWGQEANWGEKHPTHPYYSQWGVNLSSAVEHVREDSGDHDFRIAGEYTGAGVWTGDDADIPDHFETGDGDKISVAYVDIPIASQQIRLENENPDSLSIFTSKNSDEIAMNPKPREGCDCIDAFSVATGALGLAASIAGASTAGVALGATSVAAGMVGLGDDGSAGPDTYKWNTSPKWGEDGMDIVSGGHHCDFEVEEKGGKGSIKVQSKVNIQGGPSRDNEWRLKFDDGLQDVVEINSDSGGGGWA